MGRAYGLPMHGETDTNIPTSGDTSLLVTLDDTADLLGGITVRELHKRIADGDLEKVKIGRRSFVPRASIQDYVERLRREAAAERERVA